MTTLKYKVGDRVEVLVNSDVWLGGVVKHAWWQDNAYYINIDGGTQYGWFLESEVRDVQNTNDALIQRIEDLEASSDLHHRSIKEIAEKRLIERVEALEERKRVVVSESPRLMWKYEQLVKENERLTQVVRLNNNTHFERIEGLKAENEELNQELAVRDLMVDGQARNINELTKKNKDLQEIKRQLNDEINTHSKHTQALREEVKVLKNNLVVERERRRDITAVYDELMHEFRELEQRYYDLKHNKNK